MAILNTQTLILTHTLSLLTLSFILLTQPAKIASLSLVWLLGEAMHIRPSPSSSAPISSAPLAPRSSTTAYPPGGGFDTVTDPLAALALALAVMGISEGIWAGGLESGSLGGGGGAGKVPRKAVGEAVAVRHARLGQWSVLATVKSLGFGAWVVYAYLSAVSGLEGGEGKGAIGNRGRILEGLDALNNRLVFATAFVEMLFWGFVWRGVKEERRALLVRGREAVEEDFAMAQRSGRPSEL